MVELREQAVQSLIREGDDDLINEIRSIIGERIFQTSAMAIEAERPFVILKMGVVNAVGWRNGPTEQQVELWVHDKPGDYYTIDRIISLAKQAYARLTNTDNFLETRFSSVTPDLEDPMLSTILRVARWSWALTT